MGAKTRQLPAPRAQRLWLFHLLVVVIVLGVISLVLQTASVNEGGGTVGSGMPWRHRTIVSTVSPVKELPEEVPSTDAGDEEEVSDGDLLHLSLLHEACVTDSNASIPWAFGSPGHQLPNGTASNPEELMHQSDADLLQKLRQCPDVDIYLPEHLHGNGYCEDAVAYAKYLESRLLPSWILQKKFFDAAIGQEVDYFDLCPQTPMLFFNHYWDDVPNSPRWPKQKPIYLMPNIEMIELTAEFYWGIDAVICKTNECYDRITRWYDQEGNPGNTPVFYTRHTSSDQAHFARRRLGDKMVAPKNFSAVNFLHTAGTSSWKGTKQLLDCWSSTAGMPRLDVYIDNDAFRRMIPASYIPRLQESKSALQIHLGMMERSSFTKLTAEAAYILCPSRSEGYGHYINQARAAGAVIVTTDVPPMNELIIANETGFLISAQRRKHPAVMLGGAYQGDHGLENVDGLVASFSGRDVCKTIKQMIDSTTVEQRSAIGVNARRQYHQDTIFFAHAMKKLRQFARSGSTVSRSDETGARAGHRNSSQGY